MFDLLRYFVRHKQSETDSREDDVYITFAVICEKFSQSPADVISIGDINLVYVWTCYGDAHTSVSYAPVKEAICAVDYRSAKPIKGALAELWHVSPLGKRSRLGSKRIALRGSHHGTFLQQPLKISLDSEGVHLYESFING